MMEGRRKWSGERKRKSWLRPAWDEVRVAKPWDLCGEGSGDQRSVQLPPAPHLQPKVTFPYGKPSDNREKRSGSGGLRRAEREFDKNHPSFNPPILALSVFGFRGWRRKRPPGQRRRAAPGWCGRLERGRGQRGEWRILSRGRMGSRVSAEF